MTQEDKELLLKDLCARLPYGFTIHRYSDNCDIVIESNGINNFAHFLEYSEGEEFKPYLRPLSSMTEDEKDELYDWGWEYTNNDIITGGSTDADNLYKRYEKNLYDLKWLSDWLNAHHFDYRGLIEKGLALEAPKEMYNKY